MLYMRNPRTAHVNTCMYVVTLLLLTAYVSICVIITKRKFIKMLIINTNGKFTFILYWYLHVTAVSVPLSNKIVDIE